MNIAVIGAGAMGSLIGGKLAQSKHQVVLVDIWEEHVHRINEHGLKLISNAEEEVIEVINVEAVTSPSAINKKMDLIIVFVKSYHTENAVANCKSVIDPDTKVLTLQNGIGNVETLNKLLPKSQILAGTTSHGANIKDPGAVIHAGQGKTYLGRADEEEIGVQDKKIVEVFNQAGLETEYEENIMGLIWDKLMVNVGINPLTALLGIKNGEILQHEATEELLEGLVEEAASVAERKGIKLSLQDPVAHVKSIAEKTSENRSSMLQDISRGRKTEIDYINGAVVKRGEEETMDIKYNKMATLLMKARESFLKG